MRLDTVHTHIHGIERVETAYVCQDHSSIYSKLYHSLVYLLLLKSKDVAKQTGTIQVGGDNPSLHAVVSDSVSTAHLSKTLTPWDGRLAWHREFLNHVQTTEMEHWPFLAYQ